MAAVAVVREHRMEEGAQSQTRDIELQEDVKPPRPDEGRVPVGLVPDTSRIQEADLVEMRRASFKVRVPWYRQAKFCLPLGLLLGVVLVFVPLVVVIGLDNMVHIDRLVHDVHQLVERAGEHPTDAHFDEMDLIWEEIETLPLEDQEKVHAKLDELFPPDSAAALTPQMKAQFAAMAYELQTVYNMLEGNGWENYSDGAEMKAELETLLEELNNCADTHSAGTEAAEACLDWHATDDFQDALHAAGHEDTGSHLNDKEDD